MGKSVALKTAVVVWVVLLVIFVVVAGLNGLSRLHQDAACEKRCELYDESRRDEEVCLCRNVEPWQEVP